MLDLWRAIKKGLRVKEIEVWKFIEGYEERYEISNLGRCRCWISKGGKKLNYPSLINPCLTKYGYHQVSLYKNRKCKTVVVHKLVAESFIGKRRYGFQINHIDGVKINNYLSNLEYCTPKENTEHAFKIGLRKKCHFGKWRPTSKLEEKEVKSIIDLCKENIFTQKEIAKMFNVDRSNISLINNKKTWKYI